MGWEDGGASFTTLSKNKDTVLPIFADVLRNPVFREDKFTVEKNQMLEEIRRRNNDPRQIARRDPMSRQRRGHPHGFGPPE